MKTAEDGMDLLISSMWCQIGAYILVVLLHLNSFSAVACMTDVLVILIWVKNVTL